MGSCQNYGPFLGTLTIRCRIILGTQKGTMILTTTHIGPKGKRLPKRLQNPQKLLEVGTETPALEL